MKGSLQQELPLANPDYALFVERNPEFAATFAEFAKHSLAPGALSVVQKELIAIALLAASGYMGGVRSHTERALAAGATPAELREAVALLLPFAGAGRFLETYPVVEGLLDAAAAQ